MFPEGLTAQSFGLSTEQGADSGLSLMGVGGRSNVIHPVILEDEPYQEVGEKGDMPQLTQLSSNDFKFGGIDFHAEFITHPISFSSLSETRTTSRDWQDTVATSFSHLPSFTDTYQPSVITTIEPRAFGAEAEYISRLKQRRGSSSERSEGGSQARSSVIVSVTAGEGSRAKGA